MDVRDERRYVVCFADQLYAPRLPDRFLCGQKLFKCPCHGSNFSLAGDPVAGPAPVPLYHLAVSVGEDGQIVVDKNRRENRPGPRDKAPFVLKV